MSFALGFLFLALIAGVLALGGLAQGVAAEIAWIVFIVCLVLMVIAAIIRVLRGSDFY
jgi:uncharacterized membrane protein YtjA (UPF0391 family)